MITVGEHLAFDLDGVILDFVGGILECVYTEYGVRIDKAQWDMWDPKDLLNPIIGQSWWKWMRERSWLWSHFPAIPGAIGTIEKLRRDGHYLEIVTSKPQWAEYNVWRWLGKWRVPVSRVTIVGDDGNKASATDAIALIDDKPENCVEWVESDDRRWTILLDRPYNRSFKTYGNIIRKTDWTDALETIREITQGLEFMGVEES